ncbi:MAG TPA: ATP-binding protein [Spirochaetales bacterium]|nr:ATP-binding protein [Spirochaetales bacterium]HRZ65195.1 ATP-binding protein [Spirochaetia bacterium]
MTGGASGYVLLTGFDAEEERSLAAELARLGREARPGDPVNDPEAAFVIAQARDEGSLRGFRAAALDERRPWAFCVPASDRGLVAAAAAAHEGFLLLSPVLGKELKRALSAMAEEALERSAGDAAFIGLERLEASFSWRSDEIELGKVARSLARILAQAGFYPECSGEDECSLALEEALVNSLEHGNLALDSATRPGEMLEEDRYEAARAARLADPAFGSRRVRIGLSMDGTEARVAVEDEGGGFDPAAIGLGPSGLEVSGKGFWLIKRPFDSAAYEEGGRRLALAKRKPGR